MEYLVIRNDGDGKVEKEHIEVMEKEELDNLLEYPNDENIVCYFPVSYLLQGTCFSYLKKFFTVK